MPEAISTPVPTSSSPTQHLQTHLFTFSDFSSNPSLTSQLADFINICFHNSHARFPESWSTDRKRFESNQEFLDMLGDRGVFCVVYDDDDDEADANPNGKPASGAEESNSRPGSGSGAGAGGEVRSEEQVGKQRIIACAGAIPWNMGAKDTTVAAPAGTPKEEGWEIKTVCVDSGARYAKTGLAGRMEDVLARYLLQPEKEEGSSEEGPERTVILWVIAAESLRGPYWRRRGYTDVRRGIAEIGTWGCKEPFEMICLKKDVMMALPV